MNSQRAHCRQRLAAAIDRENETLDPMDVRLELAKLLLADLKKPVLAEFLVKAAGDVAIGRKAETLRQVVSALAGNIGDAAMAEILVAQLKKLTGGGDSAFEANLATIRGRS